MSHTVDLEHLDAVVSHLQAFDRRIEGELAELDARIDRLQAMWHGSAADAQHAAHRQWLEGAAKMRAGLQAMRLAGATAHANYSAAIAANTAMWG